MMDGTVFRKVRLEVGLAQFDISARSGVDRSMISLFECGRIELPDEDIVAIEKALRDLIAERANQLIGTLSSIGSRVPA
jgi:transcriptional regulator with XRE-family HTH domain